ncbi:MAG: hypothetical protein M1828_006987 [Chrysothrix sp. TS-e1954]|nr:MAG: hypothetical protein M1828_006987 [Chrysothrix sp. TS-e1954]
MIPIAQRLAPKLKANGKLEKVDLFPAVPTVEPPKSTKMQWEFNAPSRGFSVPSESDTSSCTTLVAAEINHGRFASRIFPNEPVSEPQFPQLTAADYPDRFRSPHATQARNAAVFYEFGEISSNQYFAILENRYPATKISNAITGWEIKADEYDRNAHWMTQHPDNDYEGFEVPIEIRDHEHVQRNFQNCANVVTEYMNEQRIEKILEGRRDVWRTLAMCAEQPGVFDNWEWKTMGQWQDNGVGTWIWVLNPDALAYLKRIEEQPPQRYFWTRLSGRRRIVPPGLGFVRSTL